MRAALTDPAVVKTAYNAAFERVNLGRYLGVRLDPAQWRCTMVRSARLGLPLPLGQCGEVLHLEAGKMKEGAALIRYFSIPGKNGRHYPADAPDRWATFKAYNIRDVEVEQAILAKVRRLEVPAFEDELYTADQEINDRGVLIDRQLVANAERFDTEYKAILAHQAKTLTGLDNPNSPAQLKRYLADMTGSEVETLNKKVLADLKDQLAEYPDAQGTYRTAPGYGQNQQQEIHGYA